MIAKRTEKLSALSMLMQEWNLPQKDTLYGILFDFYDAAGFTKEALAAELGAMSEDELLQTYLNL